MSTPSKRDGGRRRGAGRRGQSDDNSNLRNNRSCDLSINYAFLKYFTFSTFATYDSGFYHELKTTDGQDNVWISRINAGKSYNISVNKEFAFGGRISLTYGTFFSDGNRKTFDTDQFYYSLRSKGYSTNLSLSFSYTLYKGSPRQAIQRDDTGDTRNFTTH